MSTLEDAVTSWEKQAIKRINELEAENEGLRAALQEIRDIAERRDWLIKRHEKKIAEIARLARGEEASSG